MSYSVNNRPTTNALATVLDCPCSVLLTVTVANAAALIRIARGRPVWDVDGEQLLVPGVYTMRPPGGIDRLSARSAATGVPASISATAWPAGGSA